MKQYLQDKSLLCKYFEFCTEPKAEFEEKIGYFLHALIGDFNNNTLNSDELEENNPTNQELEYDGAESNSGCIIE
jgi:hypothetical protein